MWVINRERRNEWKGLGVGVRVGVELSVIVCKREIGWLGQSSIPDTRSLTQEFSSLLSVVNSRVGLSASIENFSIFLFLCRDVGK